MVLYETTSVMALTPIKLSIDWKFEVPAVPYFVVLSKRYFEVDEMDVTIENEVISPKIIPRLISGVYEFGFANIDSLTKFHDKNPSIYPKGILMA